MPARSPASCSGPCSTRSSTPENLKPPESEASDVPDVLAPGLTAVFCGINPGRVSAAAGAHFANPRNDFWRLLYESGFTPRLLDPSEQLELLAYGLGVTNAAFRTTPGSGDLRRADFAGSAQRLERLAVELRPRAIGFVGKEAYRGVFGERPELGPQERRLGDTALFVLPSTSPANAAVSWEERLRWFRAFRESLATLRDAVRALLLDESERILLDRRPSVVDPETSVWATPGGGIEPGESHEQALRRELVEEVGLHDFAFGPEVWSREHFFPMPSGHGGQREHFHVVRVESFEPAGTPDADVVERRWWTVAELAASGARFAPRRLPELLAALLRDGPPEEPLDVGV